MNIKPLSPKDVEQLREFFTKQSQALCGFADNLTDPLKTQFLAFKKQVDEFLGALPLTESVPAALDMGYMLKSMSGMLESMNGVLANLAGALNSKPNASAIIEADVQAGKLLRPEALPGKISEAIAEKLKSGELIEKTAHTQLCAESKTTGIAEGEKRVRDELKEQQRQAALVATRKDALQKAGLPLPEKDLEKLLGSGTDEEFAQRQTMLAERVKFMDEHGVALNSPLRANAFLADDAWQNWSTYLKDWAKTMAANGEPFATGRKESGGESPNFLV